MAGLAQRLHHQGVGLDMEIHDDDETALILLEYLCLYVDVKDLSDSHQRDKMKTIEAQCLPSPVVAMTWCPFLAPVEVATPLPTMEESVANRETNEEAQDRELEPPVAASQEDHPDRIGEFVKPPRDYYS
ncbi:hypothetical protein Aduo_005463 [Ancylostoma duodenale]